MNRDEAFELTEDIALLLVSIALVSIALVSIHVGAGCRLALMAVWVCRIARWRR